MEGFCPTHNKNNVRSTSLSKGGVHITLEDDKAEPYSGPLNERPKEAFNPWQDIREGSWLLLRASNLDIYLVWMRRALTSVCKDVGSENCGKFATQFWEPKNSLCDLAQKYKDCWSNIWIMENPHSDMIHFDFVLYASYSKIQNPKSRRISKQDQVMAFANLVLANVWDP